MNHKHTSIGRRLAWGLGIALIALIIGFEGIQQADSQAESGGAATDAAMWAQLEAGATVSLIVGFDAPLSPLHTPDAARLAAFTAGRNTLLETLANAGTAQIISESQIWAIPYVALIVDADAYRALRASPHVTSIRPNGTVRLQLAQTIPIIQADDLWTLGYDGAGQTVAVLDAGTLATHTAFGGRVVAEACFSGSGGAVGAVTLCANGGLTAFGAGAASPSRCMTIFNNSLECSHGTHVASIAIGNNASIHGVAGAATVIAVQVFSQKIGQAQVEGYDSDIIAALNYIYSLRNRYPITAVNMSFGGIVYPNQCDDALPAMTAALANLRGAGIVPVIASGNDGRTNGIGYPACISHAVSVGSTTDANARANSSNSQPALLTLFAPGTNVYAALASTISQHGSFSGTSMAAPHVSGGLALLQDAVPGATTEQLLTALRTTGSLIAVPGGTTPRIDLQAAYQQLLSLPQALTVTALLSGRPEPPNAAQSVPLAVTLTRLSDNAVLINETLTTTARGQLVFTTLAAGEYRLRLKHAQTLASVTTFTVTGGVQALSLGALAAGDANGDNKISILDFSLLATAFGQTTGQSAYDGRADFNADGVVNVTDFSLLATHFGQSGG